MIFVSLWKSARTKIKSFTSIGNPARGKRLTAVDVTLTYFAVGRRQTKMESRLKARPFNLFALIPSECWNDWFVTPESEALWAFYNQFAYSIRREIDIWR